MITAQQAYSISGIIAGEKGEGGLVSKDGSFSVAFFVENPEPYSLDEIKYDKRHGEWFKAIKGFGENTYVHKQDVVLKKRYNPDVHMYTDTFITRAEREHFEGRLYAQHFCVISFTICGLESLEKSYTSNPFSFKKSLLNNDKERLEVFLDTVEGAVSVIKNIHQTKIYPLSPEELKGYIFNSVNGFNEDEEIRDIQFGQKLNIGSASGRFFAVSDEYFLPDELQSLKEDDSLPIDQESSLSTPFMGYFDQLGVQLKFNHVVNQIIYFEGSKKLKGDLEIRRKSYGQHRDFSKSIELTHKKLESFEDEVADDKVVLCRFHFNVMVWDEDEAEQKAAEDKVKEVFRNLDVKFYTPSFEGLMNIFLGSVIGRERHLDRSYLFMTDLALAIGFFINQSGYKDDEHGILFNDRIYQIPLRKDIWSDNKRVPARNALVVSSTGGGKSSLSLNIVQQFLELNYKLIVVEFGSSFAHAVKLYLEKSAHINYDGTTPLGINPFHIDNREELTIEKLKTLSVLVLKFWRKKEIREDADQVVALETIILDYYNNNHQGYSFPSFYNYVKQNIADIFLRVEIEPEHFDVKSFLNICRQFIPGGIYENICKADDGLSNKLYNKDFVLFELSQIKKDPFLASIIMAILFETVENKILSDRSQRGILMFDEYAETQAMVDVFTGDDVHSSVAFAFQKMRKENGAVYAIVQSMAQLPDNNYTKGIIANTQILYVLPTIQVVYDQIVNAFSMKDQAQINLMQSIRNDFGGKRPHSEVFMRFQDKYATVVRLEFSRKKFYAFQTDGEDWQFLHDDEQITKDLTQSITNLMLKKNEIKNLPIHANSIGN